MLPTLERGYGQVHQALRKQWAEKVEAGEVSCARCGRWIPPGTRWHLGHNHLGAGYLGPEHALCSLRDRNRRHRRTWKRKAVTPPARTW
jgi:hypothetical protein